MIWDGPKKITVRALQVSGITLEDFQRWVVGVSYTDCKPFGGRRMWFVCPECERRCAVVYQLVAWKCRICSGMRYPSENESSHDRKLRAAIKIRERLGQVSGGIVAPFPPKPKWMRWHTYLQMRQNAKQRELEIVLAATPPEWLRPMIEKQEQASAANTLRPIK